MGSADHYSDGQWNFFCDLCGKKAKSGTGVKTWNNLYVCRHHKEVRNPQDFVKGVRDEQTVPWSRSSPPDTYVVPTTCSVAGVSAIPFYAVPGCAIPGYTSPSFIPPELPVCIPLIIDVPTEFPESPFVIWGCDSLLADADLIINSSVGVR